MVSRISSTVSERKTTLVGGFNPFDKYARRIGSSPQIEAKIKNL